jgi:cytoskeletal protein CcmA (bactofilin family)
MRWIILLLLAILLVQSAEARLIAGGKILITEPEEETLYIAGGDVVIETDINGSLFLTGGRIIVNGNINGDIYAAGGDINISGTANNIAVSGGRLVINSDTAGNLRATGGEITNLGRIEGDATFSAGQINVEGDIVGNLNVRSGQIILNSVVEGNANIYSGQMEMGNESLIMGNLVLPPNVGVDEGRVEGDISRRIPGVLTFGRIIGEIAGRLMLFLIILIIGALLLILPGKPLDRSFERIKKRFFMALLVGFLALVLIPVAAAILMITILGIPFGLLLLMFYILLILAGISVAAYSIGRALNLKKGTALIIGALIYIVLSWLPVIGGIFQFFSLMIGMGALFLALRR